MIFLIEYERRTRRTLRFKTFDETERRKAQDERLQIELDLNSRGLLLKREVLLLDSLNEQTLRRTHERYFEHLPEDRKFPVTSS